MRAKWIISLCFSIGIFAAEERLPNTTLLTTPGDLASDLVAGVDRFLLKQLADSEQQRAAHWKVNAEGWDQFVTTNRARLLYILGARDADLKHAPQRERSTHLRGVDDGITIESFRHEAFADVTVEGLILTPNGLDANRTAVVIAIPDADVTPEQLAGLAPGIPAESQFARAFAKRGCVVIVPALIDRSINQRRHSKLSNREFLYRPAFELGRNLIGYEVLKVRAIIDRALNAPFSNGKIGVMGHGEGGFVALCAGATDPRITATAVSGFFDDRRNVWQQPVDRNVFGLLRHFGDAEIACLLAPRALIVEAARGPEVTIKGEGGAPATLTTPDLVSVRREFERARALAATLPSQTRLELTISGSGGGPYGTKDTIDRLMAELGSLPAIKPASLPNAGFSYTNDIPARAASQIHEIDRHNQWLLTESPYVRQAFMSKLDVSSPEKYAATVEPYRKFFYDEVVGRFDLPLQEPNPHSRLVYDKPTWTGYEVVLDVFPDVIAYGILQVPKNIQPGERRPVVVCQHGLEGRPRDVIEGDQGAYHDYATKLVERGFITFAPQNLYIFQDRFRTLQRKANPLGKTLFSVITPQHQQIVNWLKSLPYVDSNRIGFYGLSYGGKTAMRVPALVTDYVFSICSADFNEWVWKNASSRSPYSYVWSGEYEIFEFDLGSTFNYAEMAMLIAPRPFMVERGHFDGVAPDETVGYEFAKVYNHYVARMKLPPEKCVIEWFVGPHTINGKGTFDFVHKHLNWPKP